MYREVVLNEVNMIYHKKFELKITLNFKNISMCYTEMKPLCRWSPFLSQFFCDFISFG